MHHRIVLSLIAISLAAVVSSEGHKGKAGKGKGKAVPCHVTACKNKAEAASCSFTGKDGTTITATCVKMPQGQVTCGKDSWKGKAKGKAKGKLKGKTQETTSEKQQPGTGKDIHVGMHGSHAQAHLHGHKGGKHHGKDKHKPFPWLPTILIAVGALAIVAAILAAAKMWRQRSGPQNVHAEMPIIVASGASTIQVTRCSAPAAGSVVDVPQKDAINAVVLAVNAPPAYVERLPPPVVTSSDTVPSNEVPRQL